MPPRYVRRRWTNRLMAGLTLSCVLLVLVPLFLVLGFLVANGLSAINWAFFTQLPGAAGEPGGGMGNAIAGTLMLMALAGAAGIPIGVLGGTFLAEYPQTRL